MGKAPDWAIIAHDDIEPGVIVRNNDDGTIDEVIWDKVDHFHLEQMDDGQYWIGLSRTVDGEEQMQHIMLTRAGKHIYPTVYR